MDAPFPNLPADILRQIYALLACPVDRLAMSRVCRLFRAAVTVHPPQIQAAPLPHQLPWLLLPHAEGPAFACLLSGGGLHLLDVPGDARFARYFGASRDCWLFLAFGQAQGHALLNVRTEQRICIPNATRIGRGLEEYPMVIHAVALSSSPLDEGCIAAAIVSCHGLHPARPKVTFWRIGDLVASGAFGTSWSLRVVDLVFHDGGFHCLTRDERILVCSPVFAEDGLLDVGMELRLLPGRGYDGQHVHGRYIVESRKELLMVVRFSASPLRQLPTSAFKIFRLIEAQSLTEVDKIEYSWDELPALDGRMLFVGQGCCCSTSYEVEDFPGFLEGVYFFDDRRFYNNVLPGEDDNFYNKVFPMGTDGIEYPCTDNGKWPGSSLCAGGGHVERCFFQQEEQGGYTSPTWFLL
ncbi:unnamed protein product [Urochloa decumbens]|uniref:KIB1-4 beta-propeller domain-containing protein n=1 Tax=Urochloa decumbens TaxID=240449 RepID=A0ABC8W3E6_9POAL